MKRLKQVLYMLLLAAALDVVGVAEAAPTVCSTGNMDSACMRAAAISDPAQTPPEICTGPGQIVATGPEWTGSSWTSGSCNYTPPPTCPNGTTEQTAASWNGAGWVGLSCAPSWAWGTASDGYPYAGLELYAGEDFYKSMVTVHTTEVFIGPLEPAWDNYYAALSTPSGAVMIQVQNNEGHYVVVDGDVVGTGNTDSNSSELWAFVCPVACPNINVTTFSAYADTNPNLIECAP
jgi:hypothetical protein